MPAKNLQELGQWKVGMTVLVSSSDIEFITNITRITDGRGGTVYIEQKNGVGQNYETAFDKNGHQRGSDSWHFLFIRPATSQDIENIKCNQIRYKLSSQKWFNVNNEKILKIKEIIDS